VEEVRRASRRAREGVRFKAKLSVPLPVPAPMPCRLAPEPRIAERSQSALNRFAPRAIRSSIPRADGLVRKTSIGSLAHV